MFDHFEVQHHVEGRLAAVDQALGGARAVVDREALFAGMGKGRFDVRFGRIDADNARTEPCHGLADKPAATADVQ